MIGFRTNEGQSVTLCLKFYDELGRLTTPANVYWKVEDVNSSTVLIDWTSLGTPQSVMYVTVSSDICSIVNQSNPVEIKRITFKADLSTTISIVEEVDIHVVNLGGVTS